MRKFFYLSIFIFLGFFSCKKDDASYSVTYKITETVPGSGPYYIRYTMSDGTLRSEGPISMETWMTENYGGYKKGTIVSLYLDAPTNGSYEMFIYVNNSLSSHAPADGGFGEQLLEAQIPN
jgi:hypothetical protein